MTNIHFIVNPIAGSGKHSLSEQFLQKYFDVNTYTLTIKSSEYRGHAIELTKESINQNAEIIVACGGDGTINEVASTLIGTNISLGIIPVGSGNGLASNLKIPQKIEQAVTVLKNNYQTKIDVGCVNNRYFFSNIGFGFDANVIKNYEISQTRTLYSYIKASLKSFMNFNKKKDIIIEVDGTATLINPFLIFISNSNEMGYNVSLTPKASLQDGLLDVVVVPKLNKVRMFYFGVLLLLKKPELLKGAKFFQTKALTLFRKQGDIFEAQIDGELIKFYDSYISVSLKEKSLIVIS